MTRIVCIWFPHWPLQRVVWNRQRHSPPAGPLRNAEAVVLHSVASPRGRRVVACSSSAARRGVRPGIALAEAQSLLKGVRSSYWPHDPAADCAGLRELAGCCEQYTPVYGLEECESPECLLLDVTGCAQLFGGDQGVVERIQADFQERGWHVRVALAPTIGAAWAVAHGVSRANQAVVVPDSGLEETLDELPVHVLRLPDSTIRMLSELGIHGVGQLRRLPRDRLPSRFGPQVLRRLDQAFGRAPERIVVECRVEPIAAVWAAQEPFSFAFCDRLVLLDICHRLLERMLAPLQSTRRGVRQLLCQLHGCGGRPYELLVRLVSPSNSVQRIQELLALQLERVAWQDEITWVRLEAVEVARLEERPRNLFGEQFGDEQTSELRWLLERLSSRLGADAVVRAISVPDAQPELAVAYQPWIAGEDAGGRGMEPVFSGNERGQAAVMALRPLRLFAPPRRTRVMVAEPWGVPCRFYWEQADRRVRQAWGPERIETGWWRGSPIRRDYYRVEIVSGERYWLFRATDAWFVHGVFE